MRKSPKVDAYEYIATYVDDLGIAAYDPESITSYLEKKHKFKLKGTGPIKFHLGCDYFQDEDGTLCYAPKTYIKKMVMLYEHMFGQKPLFYTSTLEKDDHPKLDTSDE